jgi:hypothetical protein
VIDKRVLVREKNRDRIESEVATLGDVRHPFIAYLFLAYQVQRRL